MPSIFFIIINSIKGQTISYKFTKEELRELLINYNEIVLEEYDLHSKVDIWDETLKDGE
ncbi:MAG: hypothetical protein ACFFB0_20705 [Promethearchaeota archaeon]